MNFSELFKHLQIFEQVAQLVPGKMPSCQAFGYRLSSLSTEEEGLLPIPRNCFWRILRNSSSLLLNDGRTQHYVIVRHISEESETIALFDSSARRLVSKKRL